MLAPSFFLESLYILLPLLIVGVITFLGKATILGALETFFKPVTKPLSELKGVVDEMKVEVALVKQDVSNVKLLTFDLRERVQQGAVELENIRKDVNSRFGVLNRFFGGHKDESS